MSTTGVFMTFDPTATSTLQANAAGTGIVPFQLGQQPFATNGGVLTALERGAGRRWPLDLSVHEPARAGETQHRHRHVHASR